MQIRTTYGRGDRGIRFTLRRVSLLAHFAATCGHLTNTYSLQREVDIEDIMRGYVIGVKDGDRFRELEHLQPSGSMLATAADVAVFLRALIDGTLLTPAEQKLYSSAYVYEHTGWNPGYTSIARYHADIDAVVVMFVNTSYDELFWLDLERVYDRVVQVLERNPL